MPKKGGRRGDLSRSLYSHISNIQDTFKMLKKPASSYVDKVEWSEVIKMGDEVSKQATIAGMLWNGEARELKELEENMEAYFNILNGFLLTCHGSTVHAGPTLHERIHDSAKQVMDCSLSLLRESVSCYDSGDPSKRMTIPQLSGAVWEACAALKKTPTTNCTAIARAITQVAVSVKDVLREMKEVKLAAEQVDNASEPDDDNGTPDEIDESYFYGDPDDELSPEEMIVAELIIDITATSLDALKEMIRFLSGLLKSPGVDLDSKKFIACLERLLVYCKEIGSQVSDLGACVYPPQNDSEMTVIVKKLLNGVGDIRRDISSLQSSKDQLFMAFQALESALGRLESQLAGDLESEMSKLALQ